MGDTLNLLHDSRSSTAALANWWWVNQNQTYTHEVDNNFMWSPKANANGNRNRSYDFMTEVRPGDIVFSFCDTYIKAIGIATGSATSSPKPDFDKAGSNWSNEGWLVPVEFAELAHPIRPKDHIDMIRPYLPSKYSPLQGNGNGLQSIYLAQVPKGMATVLIDLIGGEYLVIQERARELETEVECEQVEQGIMGRTDIGATMKEQLVKSRRGQGLFKLNVRRNEQACRVTGVRDPRNLRASHIKPWKDCSDIEKLHGCNGLLLAPHVDHLFDKGMISFSECGDMLVSPKLDRDVLKRWAIPEVLNVGSLHKQAPFLAYHREHVFKK